MSWEEIAPGVLIRRYGELGLTVGLVTGEDSALVVDTRGDHVQGGELASAVREVTALPWQVVLTHGHFDHCFGTSAFLPAPVWAHRDCPAFLARTAERQRREWVHHYRQRGDDATADALAASTPTTPSRLVADSALLDLGGRAVHLRHLGRGHTDHDLVVVVPDASVVFAGDLVEQSGPPDFEDACPAEWPAALGALLELDAQIVVPGHGDPVDPEFVRAQRAQLAELAELRDAVRSGRISRERALDRSPFPVETTRTALDR